jgi:hypothetical protein
MLVVAVASALMATACTRDSGDGRHVRRTVAVRDTSRAASDTNESGGDVVTDWIETPVKERWITDENILSLVSAMNARQIAAAQLQRQRTEPVPEPVVRPGQHLLDPVAGRHRRHRLQPQVDRPRHHLVR